MSTTETTKEIKWASEAQHRMIASICLSTGITPEEYLNDLREGDDYIEDGRRIHGKAVCRFYYTEKMGKTARERIAKIKAKKAEETKKEPEAKNPEEGDK